MAKNKRIIVEYLFEFVDPTPWSHLSDFERDLAIFFSSYQVEAEISGLLEGYAGRRIVSLTRMPVLDPKNLMNASDKTPMRSVKDQFKSVVKNMPTGRRKK